MDFNIRALLSMATGLGLVARSPGWRGTALATNGANLMEGSDWWTEDPEFLQKAQQTSFQKVRKVACTKVSVFLWSRTRVWSVPHTCCARVFVYLVTASNPIQSFCTLSLRSPLGHARRITVRDGTMYRHWHGR